MDAIQIEYEEEDQANISPSTTRSMVRVIFGFHRDIFLKSFHYV